MLGNKTLGERILGILQRVFEELDANDSGFMSLEEFEQGEDTRE